MPIPSKAFATRFKTLPGSQRVSLTTANNRFHAQLATAPWITVDSFLSNESNTTRLRSPRTEPLVQIGNEPPVSIPALYLQILDLGTPEIAVCAATLQRHLAERSRQLDTQLLRFPDYASLGPLVQPNPGSGMKHSSVNPVLLHDGPVAGFHPNLRKLFDAYKDQLIGVGNGYRQLVCDVALAKQERGLSTRQALAVTEREFLLLIEPADLRLSADAFKNRIEAYQCRHGVKFAGIDEQCVELAGAYRLYQNNRTRLTFSCPEHGIYTKVLNKLDQGCPIFRTSVGEKVTGYILKAIFPSLPFKKVRLARMAGLEFDFYSSAAKYAVEFDGAFHFPEDYSTGTPLWNLACKQAARDQRKDSLSSKNGIELQRIDYRTTRLAHGSAARGAFTRLNLLSLGLEIASQIELYIHSHGLADRLPACSRSSWQHELEQGLWSYVFNKDALGESLGCSNAK